MTIGSNEASAVAKRVAADSRVGIMVLVNMIAS